MALTELQKTILNHIAANRSETSYFAGGLVLNKDWPRRSDDIDIFHDTDEEIGQSASRDMDLLREAGFRVAVDIEVYGMTEVTVSGVDESTIIQWMSETRSRFFPLVRDDEWGARLNICDLAVNKMIAASTRSKARDFVDLAMIVDKLSSLGALAMAAAGKAPHFSPQRTIEEIRRRAVSIPAEELLAIKGLPESWTAEFVRDKLAAALDQAEAYIRQARIELVGLLAVRNGAPVEVDAIEAPGVEFRRATTETEVIPTLPDHSPDWQNPD